MKVEHHDLKPQSLCVLLKLQEISESKYTIQKSDPNNGERPLIYRKIIQQLFVLILIKEIPTIDEDQMIF